MVRQNHFILPNNWRLHRRTYLRLLGRPYIIVYEKVCGQTNRATLVVVWSVVYIEAALVLPGPQKITRFPIYRKAFIWIPKRNTSCGRRQQKQSVNHQSAVNKATGSHSHSVQSQVSQSRIQQKMIPVAELHYSEKYDDGEYEYRYNHTLTFL